MILIDTNVLLRSAQPGHPQWLRAKQAVQTARIRGHLPCIVPRIIYEYWVVATRPAADNGLGMTTTEAARDISQLMEDFRFLRDERAIFDPWRRLVIQHDVQGKTAHDARLVAAMDRHGIRHLLTFNDQHFRRFPEIEVIHPEHMDRLQPLPVRS